MVRLVLLEKLFPMENQKKYKMKVLIVVLCLYGKWHSDIIFKYVQCKQYKFMLFITFLYYEILLFHNFLHLCFQYVNMNYSIRVVNKENLVISETSLNRHSVASPALLLGLYITTGLGNLQVS